MFVQTHHQVIPQGTEKMELIEFMQRDKVVVTAVREGDIWTVSATGVPSVTADTRNDAIEAMIAMALEVCPEDGLTTMVDHVLEHMP